jgi:hypothetical protein
MYILLRNIVGQRYTIEKRISHCICSQYFYKTLIYDLLDYHMSRSQTRLSVYSRSLHHSNLVWGNNTFKH